MWGPNSDEGTDTVVQYSRYIYMYFVRYKFMHLLCYIVGGFLSMYIECTVIYILGDVNAVQLGALGGGERKVCQGVALIPIRVEKE